MNKTNIFTLLISTEVPVMTQVVEPFFSFPSVETIAWFLKHTRMVLVLNHTCDGAGQNYL